MKARAIKISIGLLVLVGLAFYLWVFHSPKQVLDENQNRFQECINEFQKKIEKVQIDPEYRVLIQNAQSGLALNAGSRKIEPLLSRNFLDLEIYKKKDLRFWSTNVNEFANLNSSPLGLSLQKYKTGWFLVERMETGGLTIFFHTPVLYEFEFPNRYLKNGFQGYFDLPAYFQIGINSTDLSKPIVNPNTRKIMGYIQLDKTRYFRSLDGDQMGSVVVYLIVFLFILQVCCGYFFEKNNFLLSIFFGMVLPGILFYSLSTFFFKHKLITISLLDPKHFYLPPFFNSLGDYALWLFYFIWIIYFLGNLLPLPTKMNLEKYSLQIRFLGFLLMGLVAFLFSFFFRSLILHANIPLDLTNIFNLNPLTFWIFGFLALTCLAFYYAQIGLIGLIQNKRKSHDKDPGLIILIIYLAFSYTTWGWGGLYLGMGITLLWIIIYVLAKNRPIYRLALFLMGISIISSIQIADLTHSLEITSRISMAHLLSNSRDSVAERLLNDIGNQIHTDSDLSEELSSTDYSSLKQLTLDIQNRYFDRSFSNFDIQYYLYSPDRTLVYGPDNISLENFQSFKDFPGTQKVTPYFYQILGKIGLNNYFGLIPISRNGKQNMGTLAIRLNARFIRENNAFQELLLDQKDLNESKKEAYSYAFYKDSSLIDKYGKYPYSIGPQEFFPLVFHQNLMFKTLNGFDHIIYKPAKGQYIVVSQPSVSLYKQGTLFSYILGFNLIFIGAVTVLIYIFTRLREIKVLSLFFEQFSSIRLLYKTRIQVSIVASVFLSLMVIGWITLAYVNNQYNLQQTDLLSNEINNLRVVFEREMPTDSMGHFNERNNRLFLDFTGGHSQDLNFYNTDGDLVYTSLQKIFDRGLLSQKMAPEAYFEMFVSGRTEFIHDEIIGKLKFLSAYTPVRNNFNNQVVGYLNLPYFANQIELKQRLSAFSNSLINVYIISFLLIGFLAIALANSLTSPLSLVEKSLGSTQIGDVNTPIPWKRDDEIGDLISGYNKMIRTLEESARKLARSERESAWREMAKQVAHEIKNPLTPLKLGIQHLERSWKEKDVHFEEKFIRFSKTFIEQIDSLSAISTEFSNFAQMPAPHEEKINLVEALDKVIHLFKASDNIKIELLFDPQKPHIIFADRDQISRAFTNLMKNSIQAMPEDKQGIIRIGIEDYIDKIKVIIEDNGSGIPKEIYPKIFQPNFTTKGSGTGLGLAFVKNVVEHAGGTIRFESEENQGTRFIIELPLLKEI